MSLNEPTMRRRRSSLKETIASSAAKAEQRLLLLFHELPAWRRDNEYITTGYRPDSLSYARSLTSIFSVHNETVNIWTHLLGSLAFLASALFVHGVVAPRYETASGMDMVVFACFFGGAVVCLSMSATYHALSNHSPAVARWGNKLDYTGIVFLIVGSDVPAIYYGFFCHSAIMATYFYLVRPIILGPEAKLTKQTFALGTGCAIASWLESFRTPRFRPYRAAMFIGLGSVGVLPCLHAISIYGLDGAQARMSVGWLALQGVWYVTGALMYAARWPESQFPRTFDICGSSHQVFHVLVLFGAATHFYGMARAFDYHHTVLGSRC